jgi:hypothetical protein
MRETTKVETTYITWRKFHGFYKPQIQTLNGIHKLLMDLETYDAAMDKF